MVVRDDNGRRSALFPAALARNRAIRKGPANPWWKLPRWRGERRAGAAAR
jgi:hypothetical protein